MTARTLQAVLRTLSAQPAETDADLLRRFLAGDEDAFAGLVRRHGRLVWAVCRHLSRSDAEADDAFQATFLVLLKNARKVRNPGRLSAWLHGVAYRICSKARLAAKRREQREHAAAVGEQNGQAVADSAWDRALVAAHEEAGRLPEALRVPFVLCCLEGKPVSEAAHELGWKLGTLSGRLTRAKDAVLARLEARGLTLGAIAALGLAAPPAAALARAASLAKVGFAIPISILHLSQGVIGMSTFSFKALAAGVMLACGLAVGAGSGWISTAGAQSPPVKAPTQKPNPEAEVQRLQAELARAIHAAEVARAASQKDNDIAGKVLEDAQQRLAAQAHSDYAALAAQVIAGHQRDPNETYTAKTKKWEYDFVVVSDMDQRKFMSFLQDRENRGWDYNGTTTLKDGSRKQEIWVFRRPVAGASGASGQEFNLLRDYNRKLADAQKMQALDYYNQALRATLSRPLPLTSGAKSDEAQRIEAEIKKLQDQLARLKALPVHVRAVVPRKELPLPAEELTDVLRKLASKKFKEEKYTITPTAEGITIEGERQVVDWVRERIKALGGQ